MRQEITKKHLKDRIAKIKRSRCFIRWCESGAFARELKNLLMELKEQISDPRAGVDLVVDFKN